MKIWAQVIGLGETLGFILARQRLQPCIFHTAVGSTAVWKRAVRHIDLICLVDKLMKNSYLVAKVSVPLK